MSNILPLFPYDPGDPKKSVKENEGLINRRLVHCVDIGYNSGLDTVTLFYVDSVGEENGYFLNIKKDAWVDGLNTALEYFIKIEDYEMCSYTKDVINRITE